jgi:hypothetical protein
MAHRARPTIVTCSWSWIRGAWVRVRIGGSRWWSVLFLIFFVIPAAATKAVAHVDSSRGSEQSVDKDTEDYEAEDGPHNCTSDFAFVDPWVRA